MSQIIEAIYEEGVLKPLEPLNLEEHTKVRLQISTRENLETKKDTEENRSFFTEQERESLEYLVKEVQEFSEEEVTVAAKTALRELYEGIFESEENLASNHDFFLYGTEKRK